MKIFLKTQKNLEFGGYRRNENAFNRRRLVLLVLSILSLIPLIVYPFHVANTPKEYMDSIFMTATGILVFISSMSIAFKTQKIFDVIDDIEQVVGESECRIWIRYPIFFQPKLTYFANIFQGLKYAKSRAMYEKTDRLVEKISKIIEFVFVYVSVPGYVLPKAIFSLFMYFTTDSGRNAFELPLPTWLVYLGTIIENKTFSSRIYTFFRISNEKVSVRLEKSTRIFRCRIFPAINGCTNA